MISRQLIIGDFVRVKLSLSLPHSLHHIRGDINYKKEEAELIFCKNTSKLLTFNEERQRQVLSRVEKDEDGSGASQIRFVFDKIFEQR